MKTNQERTMKNLFEDNAAVTALLYEIKSDAEQYEAAFSVYHELGALKAELHMMAQRFPEVEAYLAQANASRVERKRARSREIHMEQTQPPWL
jgi:hypothetical protein